MTALGLVGIAVLVAGIAWCFKFPALQNQIGLEYGKWKASGLPTGIAIVVIGVHCDASLPPGPTEPPPNVPGTP